MPNNVLDKNKGSTVGPVRDYCNSPGNIMLFSTKIMSMEQGTVNRFKPSLGNKTDRTSLDNQVRVTKGTYRFLACETGWNTLATSIFKPELLSKT